MMRAPIIAVQARIQEKRVGDDLIKMDTRQNLGFIAGNEEEEGAKSNSLGSFLSN